MQDAKIFHLLPDVFKLFYTFSYFFQTSVDLTWGDQRCGPTSLYIDTCKTKSSPQLIENIKQHCWMNSDWATVQDARQDSVVDPVQHWFQQQSYLEVFSCQPWLWLRQCPHSVCHRVSYEKETCIVQAKHKSLQQSDQYIGFLRVQPASTPASCTNNEISVELKDTLNQNFNVVACLLLYYRERIWSRC